jgi:hypothetical protein
MVGSYLRARARWRLDCAGVNPRPAARSVIALLDAASYLRDVPDSDPDIVALERAGCFHGDTFDPGPVGAGIVRGWQLADEITGGPRDLLSALAAAADHSAAGGSAPELPTVPPPTRPPVPPLIPPQPGAPTAERTPRRRNRQTRDNTRRG